MLFLPYLQIEVERIDVSKSSHGTVAGGFRERCLVSQFVQVVVCICLQPILLGQLERDKVSCKITQRLAKSMLGCVFASQIY